MSSPLSSNFPPDAAHRPATDPDLNHPVRPPALPLGVSLRQTRSRDTDEVEALAASAFGPGRFAKTAYRLRQGNPPVAELGHVCVYENKIVASITFSRIVIGTTPALLLGPLVVAPEWKNRGLGLALMRTGLAEASSLPEQIVLLVGDPPYYGRVGFEPVPPGQITLPGPVDPTRLLICALGDGAARHVSGAVRPWTNALRDTR